MIWDEDQCRWLMPAGAVKCSAVCKLGTLLQRSASDRRCDVQGVVCMDISAADPPLHFRLVVLIVYQRPLLRCLTQGVAHSKQVMRVEVVRE